MTESARPGAVSRALGRVLRLGIGVGIAGVLVYQADPSRVLASLANTRLSWVAAAIGLVLIDRALMAYRWLLLLRVIEPGRQVAFGAVMRLFFISTFLGTFLPASVGGDAVRTVGLARLQVPPADAIASVVVDRILGVVGVLLLAIPGLLIVRDLVDTRLIVGVLAVTGGITVISLLLLFDSRVLSTVMRWLTARHLPWLDRISGRLLSAVRQYGEHHRTLFTVLFASVAVQMLRTLQAWFLGLSLGITTGFLSYFAFVPLIVLFMALPLSFAGLGTSQIGFQVRVRAGERARRAVAGAVGAVPRSWRRRQHPGRDSVHVRVDGRRRPVDAASRAMKRAAALLLLIAVLGLAAILGGPVRGPLYVLLYALWTLPGLPLGFALFGVRHPVAWVSGAVLGYALTALAFWVPIALGVAGVASFAIAWILIAALTWLLIMSRRGARVALPSWTSRDLTALLLVMLLSPAVLAVPLARIGEEDATGTRRFRAYFTADFVWHMGLTAEIEKFDWPPRNPYLASESLRYYWLYFVPSSAAGATLGVAPDRVARLAINEVCTGVLFLGMIYSLTWCATRRAAVSAVAAAIAVLAASAEGAYAAMTVLQRGEPLSTLRDLNVDAVTSWFFRGITVDGLPRTLMYNPQHAMATACGLIALVVAAVAGARMSVGVALLCGTALGFGLMMSPFPGGVITLIFGVAVVVDLARSFRRSKDRRLHSDLPNGARGDLSNGARGLQTAGTMSIVGVPIALALGWCVLNGTFEGAGGELRIGLSSRAMAAPVLWIALALGPLLSVVLLGLVANWKLPRAVLPAVAGLVLPLGLIYFVTLTSADVWVGWRAGQVLLATTPGLAAAGVDLLLRAARPLAYVVVTLVLLTGLPTTLIDVYNAQDVHNLGEGPGFAWTVRISRAEQEALDWIKSFTARDAIVQMEPTERKRETWTLIPSFAERRMAAGLPISLLESPAYHQRSQQVREIYTAKDPDSAWRTARALGIQFLYLGRVERTAFPGADQVLTSRPDRFVPVFQNRESMVLAVQ